MPEIVVSSIKSVGLGGQFFQVQYRGKQRGSQMIRALNNTEYLRPAWWDRVRDPTATQTKSIFLACMKFRSLEGKSLKLRLVKTGTR